MMKLQTPVTLEGAPMSISYNDKIVVLGSCFADEIGGRLAAAGFKVLQNPFGTLYNPVSIGHAIARLGSGSKGFLPTIVDIWSSELNSPIPVHFSLLIPRMSTFMLAISCLTTSNLP